jgi:hypothetical protein
MQQHPPAESQHSIVSGNTVGEFAIQINGPAVRTVAEFGRGFTISGNVVKRGGLMIDDILVLGESEDSEDRGRDILTALSELSALGAGNSDSLNPVINIKTWTAEHHDTLRYDTRENINEGGIMINGPVHGVRGFMHRGYGVKRFQVEKA